MIFVVNESYTKETLVLEKIYIYDIEGWVRGGGEPPSPEFGRSVIPIQTKGADYTHYITASPPRIQKAIYIYLCWSDWSKKCQIL